MITTLALFSGLTASVEQTVRDLINLFKNPTETVTQLYNLAKMIWDDYTIIADLITGAVEGIQNTQQRANPFGDSGPVTNVEKEDFETPSDLESEYSQFAVGWYGGYALGFIAEAVLGSKGVSKIEDIARTSSRIETALDAAGRLRAATIGRATGYARSSAVRIGTELRERAPELDTQALRRALSDRTTTVQQRIATRLADDVDPDARQIAADGGFDQRLVRYLEVGDEDQAARLLNTLADGSDASRLTARLLDDGTSAQFQRSLARQFDRGEIDAGEARTVLRRLDEADSADRQQLSKAVAEGGPNGGKLVARTDSPDSVATFLRDADDGVELIQRFDDPDTLNDFFELDVGNADMDAWRRDVAETVVSKTDDSANLRYSDVEEYTESLDTVEDLNARSGITIRNRERLVREVIGNQKPGQVLGQKFEARRTAQIARERNRVTVEPDTPGDKEPDLRARGTATKPPLYTEQKLVSGDLDNGIKIKDKIFETDSGADGSFNGITESHDEVVEISAQGRITDDFNPETEALETPKQSFKGLIEAKRDGVDIRNLPRSLSDVQNPDMTIRVIDEDGAVVDGGEFTLREVYEQAQ